jgi:PiT family inorganic phosphate transporter
VSAELVAALAVIVAAMVFDYTNGFHDAANAIATSVSTRALTPRAALGIAAIGNLVGAFLGRGWRRPSERARHATPGVLSPWCSPASSARSRNLITWYFGLPSVLARTVRGLSGGASYLGKFGPLGTIISKIVIPMVVSPIVGAILGFAAMLSVLRLFRNGNPHRLNRGFRTAQSVSATAMAVGHGMQDAAKTMGIIVLALFTGGFQTSRTHIPWWVFITSATVLALGTYSGGWRIIRTLGRRVIHLGPPEGFAAETVASGVLYFNALVLHAPISTTHTITSAIMGVGATKRLSSVRWGVAGNIVVAWILTFPGAGLLASLVYLAVQPLF